MDHPDLPNSVLSDQFHLGLPSRPHWIEPTVEYLQQRAMLCGACEETRMNKLTISLHEALTNAIVHGNLEVSSVFKEVDDDAFAQKLAERAADPKLAERTVEVEVEYNGDRCVWTITDQGAGFDFEQAIERAQSDDPELLLASGRGILIMLSFMDELRYELGGKRLVLTLKRESGLEKRRFARTQQHEKLQVTPIRPDGSVDWDAAYQAVSRNLSADGVALLQKQLEAGERILIGMEHGDKSVYFPAQVRHVRSLTDDVIELGCQFDRHAPAISEEAPIDENVGPLIDEYMQQHQAAALPKDQRRKHQRVAFTERIGILFGEHEQPVSGFARDLSKGGVAFITNVSMPKNVVVCFPKKLAGREVLVRAQVVHSTEVQHGFYDVGARFLSLELGESADS